MASSVWSLISVAEQGDRAAAEPLFVVLYSERHSLAKRELARQGAPLTLGATSLLHQAYIDMAGRDGPEFPDRARFMGYAARVMRGGDTRAALSSYRQLLANVMAAKPDVTDDLQNTSRLSRLYERLGQLYAKTADVAEADTVHEQRLRLWTGWDAKLPGNEFVRRQIAAATLPLASPHSRRTHARDVGQ